jgi:hypothetical protein
MKTRMKTRIKSKVKNKLENKLSALMALLLLATLTSGCATQYRKRDEEATKKVKTAAIIAFIDKEPASDVMSLNLGSGSMGKEMGGSSFYQPVDSADTLYRDLAAAVSKATGWVMASRQDVTSNAIYKDEAKKMMIPVQLFFLPKSGENWLMAHDIMVPTASENLGREGRAKIMNALGVDAVVVAEVSTNIKGGFSLNGFGPRRPQSKFDMQVYRRDSKEPIWLEGVTGLKSEESLGWVGFIDEKRLAELSHDSAKSAFDRVGAEIK